MGARLDGTDGTGDLSVQSEDEEIKLFKSCIVPALYRKALSLPLPFQEWPTTRPLSLSPCVDQPQRT